MGLTREFRTHTFGRAELPTLRAPGLRLVVVSEGGQGAAERFTLVDAGDDVVLGSNFSLRDVLDVLSTRTSPPPGQAVATWFPHASALLRPSTRLPLGARCLSLYEDLAADASTPYVLAWDDEPGFAASDPTTAHSVLDLIAAVLLSRGEAAV